MSKPAEKTLGMRALDREGISYTPYYFPEDIHDALGVAAYCSLPSEQVFKTLVIEIPDPDGKRRPAYALVLIPGGYTLDLKQAAAELGVKRLAMARREQAERVTGLKAGGISALGLLGKGFGVFLDERARSHTEIVVSAGRRGINLKLGRDDFIRLTGARWLKAGVPAQD